MAGRDEEFKKKILAGAVDLGAVAEGPPDPRKFPFTLTEVTFRQTYHELAIIRDEHGNALAFQFSIVDPADRHVYHYSFNERTLDDLITTLQAMKSDAGTPPVTEVLQ